MAKSSIGKISSLFKGIIGTFTASTYVQVIDGLIEVSNGLKRLASASEDINSAKLVNIYMTSIKQLKLLVEKITFLRN